MNISRSDLSSSSLLPIMKTVDQWICWAYSPDGEMIPLDTDIYDNYKNQFSASSYRDSSIWMQYQEAKRLASKYSEIDGFGFVTIGKNISYIDFDECLSPQGLALDDRVYSIINRIHSYTEISSSGTGLHVYCRGESPSYGWAPGDSDINIEIFDRSWVAVTEDHVASYPQSVQGSENHLIQLCQEFDIDTHGGWTT